MRKFVKNFLSPHDSPQRTSGLRGWNRATFGHVAKWGTWLLLAGLLAGCSSALQSTGVPLAPAGGCLQAAAAAAPEVLRPAVQGVGRFDLPHLPGRVIVYQEG
ncbi:peptidase S8 and S53 subtilisin kexin sedolisin, partial [Acinetobacter pittii]|nr:peptidase S8 and S53 subtilisin kexin sedolisin [Acinetobacter pittii]